MAVALVATVLVAGCQGLGSGDADGLRAEVEGNGWTVRVTYPNMTQRDYSVTSNPGMDDTDKDGLDDFQEWRSSTDPRNIDTDEDGLLDGPHMCPDAGSTLSQKAQEEGIMEHPEKPGCYLGESPWTFQDVRINTKPTDAHSDNGRGIGDNLTDSEELHGWDVTVAGRTYHTFSNPSTPSPDSDGDGLHDGLEKHLGTDPLVQNTDGDAYSDFRDAAPLGNLVLRTALDKIDLKDSQGTAGGADLRLDVRVDGQEGQSGPRSISTGPNDVGMQITFDVRDEGSIVEGESYAAGHWVGVILMTFWHESPSGDEPIEVRGGESNQNTLELRYDSAQEDWTGHAQGGTSAGPEADVWVSVNHRVTT